MSILQRQRLIARPKPEIAVFISMSLPEDDRNALFDIAVHKLGARADGRVLVIPCDEQGIVPGYRDRVDLVRGLPAHFLGLSRPLRREIERHYECRSVRLRRDAVVKAKVARLKEAEASLLEAKRLHAALRERNADLPDVNERLEAVRASVDRLLKAYLAAFEDYHAAVLAHISGGNANGAL